MDETGALQVQEELVPLNGLSIGWGMSWWCTSLVHLVVLSVPLCRSWALLHSDLCNISSNPQCLGMGICSSLGSIHKGRTCCPVIGCMTVALCPDGCLDLEGKLLTIVGML